MLVGGRCENDKYLNLLSRGGLKTPSQNLCTYVCNSFAILDASSTVISDSVIPVREAAEYILQNICKNDGFTCEEDDERARKYVNRIVTNVFYNNKRKLTTSSVVNDRVKSFKKSKRQKAATT